MKIVLLGKKGVFAANEPDTAGKLQAQPVYRPR
jgi:hypothetical protein